MPAWHAAIIGDRARNEAYDAALRNAIEPGMRVLEVGAGTGLLAMMAARAGAAEVVTCEINPLVAERARQIVAQNGYADRVRVIGKHSGDLKLGVDLSGPADVFVSEIISGSLLNEAVLPVMEDVVPRLLKPGAIVIPFRASIRVALAYYGGAPAMRMEMSMASTCRPSTGCWRRITRCRSKTRLTLDSAAADLFAFISVRRAFPDAALRTFRCAPRRAPMAWCNGSAFAPTMPHFTKTRPAPAKARAGARSFTRLRTGASPSPAKRSPCMAVIARPPCASGRQAVNLP